MKGLERFRKLSCWWRYGRRLSAYLDNELSSQSARAMSSHISDCTYCRGEVEELRFANRALVDFEIPLMPTPIVAGNVYRLPQPKVSLFTKLFSQRISMPLPLAIGLAITLTGIAVSGFVWSGTSAQPPMTVPAAPAVVVEFVKVPVERVVTRTVYLKQASQRTQLSERKNGRQSISADSNESLAHNNSRSGWSDSLTDFRPAANANLRVIKEREE